jgi:hypothetical protein
MVLGELHLHRESLAGFPGPRFWDLGNLTPRKQPRWGGARTAQVAVRRSGLQPWESQPNENPKRGRLVRIHPRQLRAHEPRPGVGPFFLGP